jgi:adenylate cyclase
VDEQAEVLEQLEQALLGGRRFTRLEVAEKAGVDIERAVRLWRALGFASVADSQLVFGESDVEALGLISAMVDSGVVSEQVEASLARSLGQTMARLADWQAEVLRDVAYAGDRTPQTQDETLQQATDLVPVMEKLQTYVWRRHLIAAAGRMLPVAADDPESDTMVAGFADIVGFTSLSRSIGAEELARLVDHFEGTTAAVIAEHGGRVVKTIGDEVLFVVDSPTRAADIALALMSWTESDEDVPKLRIGMAYGRVISLLGDVYGPIVNVASRLTSVARPGATLVDRDLAAALDGEPDYALRKIRRVTVRGYSHLEPWVLRSSV